MKTYSRNLKSPCPLREQSDKYEDYCRLCLTKDTIMIHIFNEDEIVPIPLKLKYTTALEVSEDDGLPCGICTDCISKLDESYAFKKRCLATDGKLRQYIQLPFSNNLNSSESSSKVTTITETSSDPKSKDACTIKLEDSGFFFLNEICTAVNKISNENSNTVTSNLDISTMNIGTDTLNSTFDTDLNNGELSIDNNFCGEKTDTILELHGDLNIDHSLVESSQPKVVCTRKKNKNSLQLEVSQNKNNNVLNSDELEEEKGEENECVNNGLESDSLPTKLGRSNYRCYSCSVTFATYKRLLDHKHAEHSNSIKMCSFCTKTFISNSTLERHLRIHTGERPYNCNKCGKRFTQKEILRRHLLTHNQNSSKSNLCCSYCNVKCNTEEALHKHVKTRHATFESRIAMTKYKCRHCDKTFCHASGLSRHQAVHAGLIYRCVSCTKSFSDKSSVRRHFVKSHPNLKNPVKHYQIISYQNTN